MIDLIDAQNQFRVTAETTVSTSPLHNPVRQYFEQNLHRPTPVVFVWDGAGGNKRRRDIYPAYKSKRTPSPENIFAQMAVLKRVMPHTAAFSIEVPGYEADDVIAHLAHKFAGKSPVLIHSTDGDLYALKALSPNYRTTREDFKGGILPEQVRLYKTLVGDSSDSIAGVKGFGQKAWLDVARTWRKVQHIIAGERIPNPGELQALGFKPGPARWVTENWAEVKAMWTIIGFIDIPDDVINQHLIKGTPDRAAAEKIMKEFLL